MKQQTIGSLHVSELGFGCMSLSDDEKQNEALLRTAAEGGITYFDTADLYQYGDNERSVGRILKPYRDNVTIATKGGNEFGEGIDKWRWNASSDYLKKAVKASLTRLQLDYIDVYQLHGGTLDDDLEAIIDTFEELKKEGLIREYGMSSIRPNVIKRFAKKSGVATNMMQYSLLDRRPEELFPLLEQANIGVIARGPVAKGLLTDTYSTRNMDDYLSYSKEELEQTLGDLHSLAKEANVSLEALALNYILAQDAVKVAIPGASSVDQLKKLLHAAESTIDDAVLEKAAAITKQSMYEEHRS
ncbi:aldo/keto reductase [Paenalkalicoccus suaedae]|uniref:Aldo/keto reductase n=1 Tax=Paenalkalicoccus suaedae TaxID=2592382 RepID=A0A859FDV1_9BACI|nr:aldo/keto reductase [Paenalkalicoccus suaedae]QKS71018.1 aldo/keto reductase [Paenalkalicoccus suaedae]